MFSLSKLERDNIRHLYSEIFWYGIYGGTTLSFWGVYAAHLGATSFQVGLLTSVPGLVNLLFSLPSGILIGKGYPEKVTFVSSVLTRVFYILLIFLPWMGNSETQIWLIVLVAFLSSIPGTILTIAANVMLGEVLPPEWRATVIGRRFAFLSISITGSLIFSGIILDRVIFPLNYQIVFGIGLIGLALSSYHLGKVVSKRWFKDFPFLNYWQLGLIFKRTNEFLNQGKEDLRNIKIRKMLRLDLLRGTFGKFIGAYLIFYTFLYVPTAIYTLFLVDTIKVSDGVISIGNSLYYCGMFIFSMLLGKLSKKIGHHTVLVIGAFILSFYPFLGGLAYGPLLFYIASFLGGLANGLTNGALINRLFEKTPDKEHPTGMALNNLVLNIGMMVGVLSGSWLGSMLGLRDALIIGGFMRIVSASVLIFWG